jgi:uncharacterized protein YaiL (DUF2058 family)
MLDLRAQLLKAGLVSKEQADKAEKEAATKKSNVKAASKKMMKVSVEERGSRSKESFEEMRRRKQLDALKQMDKNQKFDVIRRWVMLNRLDGENSSIGEPLERFFFEQMDQSVGWLMLPASLIERLKNGKAGVMAFMSHHGLAHAVVANDIIVDVREVFPEWIRFFENPKNSDA